MGVLSSLPFHLAAALAVVSGAAAVGGALARRAGQPRVVGEIAAGIALGPSLFGALAPAVGESLFTPATKSALAALATVGVVLFMLSVGLDLDVGPLAWHRPALAITHANVLVVAGLGIPAGLIVSPVLAGPRVSTVTFTAFLCVALSVTALPVLARMLGEPSISVRGLAPLALTCAALSDAAVWCALIAVAALATASTPLAGLRALGLAVALAAVALTLGRRFSATCLRRLAATRAPGGPLLLVLALAALFAYVSDAIGIHVIVGAFLAGVMLRGARPLLGNGYRRLLGVNNGVLLPVFFAFLGLQMDVRHLGTDPQLMGAGLLVFAVAVGGKLGGVALTARVTGATWRNALGLAVLLNTRGLTEAVVLQLGLALGVLSRDGFAVLILVALATTLMTLPLLRSIGFGRDRSAPIPESAPAPPLAPADGMVPTRRVA